MIGDMIVRQRSFFL